MKIRISGGVGSSPKLWAVGYERGNWAMCGEFDNPADGRPGWVDGAAMGGMTGIVWPAGGGLPTDRKLYGSVDEWVADVAAEYPGTEIIRADGEPVKYRF